MVMYKPITLAVPNLHILHYKILSFLCSQVRLLIEIMCYMLHRCCGSMIEKILKNK